MDLLAAEKKLRSLIENDEPLFQDAAQNFNRLDQIKGIGEAAANRIEAVVAAYWAKNPRPTVLSMIGVEDDDDTDPDEELADLPDSGDSSKESEHGD